MRLLLDTHSFLFALREPERLSSRVRGCLGQPEVERYVSVVSFWEIAVKVQIGRLTMPIDPAYYSRQLRLLRAKSLPVELNHALALFALPLLHKDPFDRLLIGQAQAEGLTIVTRDSQFAGYGIPCLW